YSYEIETKLSENIENSNDFDIRLSGKAGQLFNSVAGWSNVSASVVDGSNNQVAQLNGTYWATNDERVLEFSTTSDLLSQHEYFIKISFSANDISPLPVTQ
ncbi:MAG: hypothetical protein LBD05_03035, partial [Mycoplasmataceae bacterium]|nr:hypothetical protein [Mycoplasmataceae bacterium]